jgi:hypothetical protein
MAQLTPKNYRYVLEDFGMWRDCLLNIWTQQKHTADGKLLKFLLSGNNHGGTIV